MNENAEMINEPARDLPVSGCYDVVVVGGGIAGVAAALAATRLGASACLIEKEYTLGGLATLGNVIFYLPICDGMGNQVIGGLGEELLRLSVSDIKDVNQPRRLCPVPPCWEPDGDKEERLKTRFRTEFNPSSYMLELERVILEHKVDLLYDTRFCSVVRNDTGIDAVVIENKDGRSAIRCRTVVDATGDADVCALAGEDTESLDSNVLAGWCYYSQGDKLFLKPLSHSYSPKCEKLAGHGPHFAGDSAAGVTGQVVGTRKILREFISELREKHPDEQILPIQISTFPGFRMTRRLRGAVELREADERCYVDDCIGMTGDWRKKGPIYYVPFRSLTGVRNANLLTAGRCISSDTTVWDVTRAIPTCSMTGEAAGTAAAMACRDTAGDLRDLPIKALQDQLLSQGVIIDRSFANG